MAALIPYIPYMIQVLEALFVALTAAGVAHQAGGDLNSSLVTGVTAFIAKLVPSQVVAKK
jgi:uncharacterized membrane protein YjjP (DUF1212 family)